jgi:hypothetical protein
MRAFSTAIATLCLALIAATASAQQDLQPGVQTSSSAAPTASPPNAAAAPAGARTPEAANSKPKDARPAVAAPAGAKAASPAAPGAAPKVGKASDHIELDTTQISGNRELPKVMYVVPWRRADPGEFTGRPLNSLLDEALTPVDRDVFRRQNRYYAALQGEPGSAKSQPEAAAEGSAAPTPKDEK